MPVPRNRLLSPRLARRRRKVLIQKAVFLGVATLLLAASAVWLSHLEAITISKISVAGTSPSTANAVEEFIQHELAGKYWHLFPKANVALFPRSAVEAAVLDAFPRLSSIELRLGDLDFIQAVVTERSSAALWCEAAKEEGASDCYYLDQSGVLFEKAPVFEGNVFLRVYGGISKTPHSVGSQVLAPEQFKKLYSFIISLRDLKLTPTAVAIDAEGDYAITLKGGVDILVGDNQDVSEVRENLEAILGADEFKDGKLERLEYLDLRFGNKVYLKEKK